ncbi:hypothetical protein ABPG73_017624 [Tetrahymena malaccensis]
MSQSFIYFILAFVQYLLQYANCYLETNDYIVFNEINAILHVNQQNQLCFSYFTVGGDFGKPYVLQYDLSQQQQLKFSTYFMIGSKIYIRKTLFYSYAVIDLEAIQKNDNPNFISDQEIQSIHNFCPQQGEMFKLGQYFYLICAKSGSVNVFKDTNLENITNPSSQINDIQTTICTFNYYYAHCSVSLFYKDKIFNLLTDQMPFKIIDFDLDIFLTEAIELIRLDLNQSVITFKAYIQVPVCTFISQVVKLIGMNVIVAGVGNIGYAFYNVDTFKIISDYIQYPRQFDLSYTFIIENHILCLDNHQVLHVKMNYNSAKKSIEFHRLQTDYSSLPYYSPSPFQFQYIDYFQKVMGKIKNVGHFFTPNIYELVPICTDFCIKCGSYPNYKCQKCQKDYYFEDKCYDCYQYCKTCFGINKNECSSCYEGYDLINNSCSQIYLVYESKIFTESKIEEIQQQSQFSSSTLIISSQAINLLQNIGSNSSFGVLTSGLTIQKLSYLYLFNINLPKPVYSALLILSGKLPSQQLLFLNPFSQGYLSTNYQNTNITMKQSFIFFILALAQYLQPLINCYVKIQDYLMFDEINAILYRSYRENQLCFRYFTVGGDLGQVYVLPFQNLIFSSYFIISRKIYVSKQDFCDYLIIDLEAIQNNDSQNFIQNFQFTQILQKCPYGNMFKQGQHFYVICRKDYIGNAIIYKDTTLDNIINPSAQMQLSGFYTYSNYYTYQLYSRNSATLIYKEKIFYIDSTSGVQIQQFFDFNYDLIKVSKINGDCFLCKLDLSQSDFTCKQIFKYTMINDFFSRVVKSNGINVIVYAGFYSQMYEFLDADTLLTLKSSPQIERQFIRLDFSIQIQNSIFYIFTKPDLHFKFNYNSETMMIEINYLQTDLSNSPIYNDYNYGYDNYLFEKGMGKIITYGDEDNCSACNQSCKTCIGFNFNECRSCYEGYDLINHTCRQIYLVYESTIFTESKIEQIQQQSQFSSSTLIISSQVISLLQNIGSNSSFGILTSGLTIQKLSYLYLFNVNLPKPVYSAFLILSGKLPSQQLLFLNLFSKGQLQINYQNIKYLKVELAYHILINCGQAIILFIICSFIFGLFYILIEKVKQEKVRQISIKAYQSVFSSLVVQYFQLILSILIIGINQQVKELIYYSTIEQLPMKQILTLIFTILVIIIFKQQYKYLNQQNSNLSLLNFQDLTKEKIRNDTIYDSKIRLNFILIYQFFESFLLPTTYLQLSENWLAANIVSIIIQLSLLIMIIYLRPFFCKITNWYFIINHLFWLLLQIQFMVLNRYCEKINFMDYIQNIELISITFLINMQIVQFIQPLYMIITLSIQIYDLIKKQMLKKPLQQQEDLMQQNTFSSQNSSNVEIELIKKEKKSLQIVDIFKKKKQADRFTEQISQQNQSQGDEKII